MLAELTKPVNLYGRRTWEVLDRAGHRCRHGGTRRKA